MKSTNPKDKIGRMKPSISLIPPVANLLESEVMALGAFKYTKFNWRRGKVAASVYVDAMYRHLMAYMDGQTYDEESGMPHIAHARACTGILLDAFANGTLIDDRPEKGKAAQLIKSLTKKSK